MHNVLGRTREGTSRLPGATDENPLGGGLRIGKQDEGGSAGDGQYHHYLTLWMFALNRLSKATNDPAHNEQAIALAKAIHPHFFLGRETANPRMIWKAAMDLSKPLVYSQGNLDPIDGLLVFRMLQGSSSNPTILQEELADYARVIELKGKHFVSRDTLDLGMTLWTSQWLDEKEDYFSNLTDQAMEQLGDMFARGYLDVPVSGRLAFRDYGTCLGIGCTFSPGDKLATGRNRIVQTWEKYRSETPRDLRPITEVMRAAALIPGAFKKGYLGPEPDI